MPTTPTEDPNWRHEHVPTGKTRQCEGCKATWPVTCHNHNRLLCDSCRQGQTRKRDRERKQAGTAQKKIINRHVSNLIRKLDL